MRDRASGIVRRIIGTFAAFSPGQKAMSVFAVIALAIGGYFFANWAATPAYAPLYNNLAAADASAVVDKLTADAVPYQLTNGGQTIMVPQDQVYAERIKLSGAGLPGQSTTGYALLDKQGVMTSDFMQRVDYQRALEGELANTIKSITGVTGATVHLAIPTKDVFTDDQKKPTASVLVSTSASTSLTQAQVQAVVHLVASSVEGLDTGSVTVVGAGGKVLSGDASDAAGGSADTRTQQTQSFEQRMGSSLQAMLDQVVGEGHAAVKVTADLDYDQTETKTQKYIADPSTPPLAESKKIETYNGTGSTGTGVLGPDNIQVPATIASASAGGYGSASETKNNAVGMITESRKSAPGAVRKLSVAVLLDSKTAAGTNEAQLQQLVSSAVGLDAARGDTIAVSALPFDKSAADQAKAEQLQIKKDDKLAQRTSMIKNGSIVGAVVLLVLIAMVRGRRRNKRLRKLLKAEVAQTPKAQPAVENASRLSIEADDGEAVLALEARPDENDGLALEREIRQREIADLVEKQPDEVAQLLRGWLADRRG
jgi:flagellar M-ring protein FliF